MKRFLLSAVTLLVFSTFAAGQTALFTADVTVTYRAGVVQFTSQSVGATSWAWDFGDGSPVSALENPSHTYTTAGRYDVTLTINSGASTLARSQYIHVLPNVGTPYTVASSGATFETNIDDFGSQSIRNGINLWERGVPSNFLTTVNSPNNAWKTDLDADIVNGDYACVLQTPSYNLTSNASAYTLRFRRSMEIVACNGPVAVQLQYTTDRGQTWTRLGVNADPASTNWYNRGPATGCPVDAAVFPDRYGWTITSNNSLCTYNLTTGAPGLIGQPEVAFRFVLSVAPGYAVGSYAVDGFMVDDFEILGPVNSAYNILNSSPIANNDSGPSLTEDGSNGTVDVLMNDTDPDGNPTAPVNGVGQFTVDLDPGTPGIQSTFTDAQGVWTLNTTSGIVTFDPALNYNGTALILYTLCDPAGACDDASITFVVTPVNDPPVANCMNLTGYLNASGNFNIVPAMINNGSTDDDGIVSMSVTPTSLSCANLGANNVTLTVYDAQGLSSTCIGIVTIMDSIRPSITSCASAQTIVVGAGCTALIPNYTLLVAATDNCGVPTLTQSPAPGSSISLGATVSITVQATDASGNASLCVFNLTAVGPEMNVIGNAQSIVDGDVTPSTSDHTDFGSVLACTGTIVRTYTIQNTGNANLSAVAATITGTHASDFSVTVLPSSTVTASGSTTLQITFNPSSTGLRSASVNIANSDCNENPYNFSIQGTGNADVTSPVFTSCPGTITVNADSGICTTVVNFTTPTATDNCPSGLTVTQIAGLPSGSAFPGGMNTVTFRATDGSGNFTDCSFQINVYDNTAPIAVCSNITAYVNSSGTATIDLFSLGIGSSDNCACIASRAYDLNNDGTYDVVAGGSVNQNFSCPAGTRFIPVRVTDCFGLNSFCAAQLTILDTFPPAVVCQNITVNLNTSGSATILPIQLDGGSSDACGIASRTLSQSTFTCANIGANNVTLTVTDVNGNSSTCTSIVTVVDTIRPVVNTQNLTLHLNASGNASVIPAMVNNGSTDACGIASMSVAPNSFSCANIGANTVTLTVTDVNGNSNTGTAIVTVADTTRPVAICQNISVTLSGGMATITGAMINNGSYDNCSVASLSASPNTFTCANTGANTVTLTVTDQSGNSSTCTAIVTVLNPVTASASSPTFNCGTNVSCNGATNGSATVTPGGGVGPYTYLWSNMQTTATASGLGAGTYTVTITDAGGCGAQTTVTLTEPAPMTSSASSPTFIGGYNVSCNGAADGSATVTVTSGCPTYTYLWSNGQTSSTATGLTAGTLTYTVTSSNGCTSSGSITLSQPSPLSASVASQNNVSCYGGNNGAASVNVSGGTAGYSFNWAPGNPTGDGTNSVSGLTSGTWTCVVTDANNCTTTQTFNIISPPALIATAASQTNISCFGGSNGTATVSASGGGFGYNYSWAPSGGVLSTATGLSAGNYTVTVTDGYGCTATQTFNITSPSVINVPAASATYVSCFGGSNGAASINTPTGGAGGYTYNWTPGNPTGDGTVSVSGLTAGTWTCTVTDANSCTATQTFNITQPAQVVASAAAQTNILCNGAATGAATVSASGGTSSYTYSWAPTGGTAATATALTAGTYTATVTDGNGCAATQTFNITQPSALSATTMQTNISCNAGSNGDAMVMISGGTGSYTYSWSPSGGTAATATGLTAGTYTCTTTDANGCTLTNIFNITSPSALVAGASSQTNVLCNGATSGAATVGAAGGAGSYSYSWAPSGGTAATATGLAAGVYTVTVTDANSCTATQTFNITQPSALSATTMQSNVSCNAGSNGDAMVMVSGGTGSYTYSWAPSGGTIATATGLTAGTYTCTTTDANGCTLTSTVSITEPSVLTAASSASTLLCNGDTSTVAVTASGGVSPYTGAGSFSEVAGTYTYTITDNNGCTTTTSVTITEPTAISTVVASTNVLCNGDSTGSIDLTVTGGTAPYTFNWNSGAFTTEDLTNIPAGSYSGVLTDANGCTDGGTVVINEPAVLAATAVVNNPTGCTTNDGAIDLSVAGGTPGYAYVWSTTATTEDVTALDGGNYTITVTDTNGCSVVESFTLTEPLPPTVTFSAGLDTVCQSTTTPFTLTGASPAGGVFTGTGMINDTVFDPMTASIGFNVITYTYTDAGGCTGTAVDSILVDVCTALASQVSGLTPQVSIFPNPNNGAFTVITSTFADMMICDAQGKLVAAQKVQANVQNQINIENSGMYLITIVAADGSRTTQRVMVTK